MHFLSGEPVAPPARQLRDPLVFLGICTVVVLVYGSLLSAPPLIWDDEPHIFANPSLQHDPWWKAWAAPYFGMYIPLINTIWKALFHLSDGAVWPFRLLNLVLHLVNIGVFTALLAGLFRRFELRASGALLLGVAIFALHPQQTATVSWISGGRDLAAAAFALAAVGTYFSSHRYRLAGSTLLFAAGLLCKPHIAGVPLAIVVFVWYFDRGRFRTTLHMMGVWLALVAASAAITSYAQAGLITVDVPLLHRPLVALDALGFHLLKALVPYPLASDYGRTPAALWLDPRLMVPTIGVLVTGSLALWYAIRRDPMFRLGFVWPIVLAPVLGLVPFAYQAISTVADHYNYIPLAVLSALAAMLVSRAESRGRAWVWGVLLVVVSAGGISSWQRTRDWIGNERFFADMLDKNPASFSAKLNLSTTHCERGDWQQGLPLIKGAFALDSTSAPVLANLSYCLYVAKQFEEALELQRRLHDREVRYGLAQNGVAAAILANSLAGIFVAFDKPEKAFAYLCQGQAVQPQDPDIATNVAAVRRTLLERGRRVRCPGLLPWDVLAEGVATLP